MEGVSRVRGGVSRVRGGVSRWRRGGVEEASMRRRGGVEEGSRRGRGGIQTKQIDFLVDQLNKHMNVQVFFGYVGKTSKNTWIFS